MAKLTSQQRDHFVNRINEQFQTTLGPLEKVAASKKAEMVDEKFDEFIESLGLTGTIKEFIEAENKFLSLQQTLSNHLTNLREQYDMEGLREWSWQTYNASSCAIQVQNQLLGMQQNISNHMTNLKEQYGLPSNSYGGNTYEWSWNTYGKQAEQIKSELLKMCRKECEIAFKSIPEGQEIEKLKNKKTEAIDYVMGFDQQAELLNGLSNVLNGSGVMMLQEYKEVK